MNASLVSLAMRSFFVSDVDFFFLLKMVKRHSNSPSQQTLHHTNQAHDAEPNAQTLPIQASALVQPEALVAQVAAEADDRGDVPDGQGARGAVRQLAEPLRQDAVGASGAAAALLLGQVGLGPRPRRCVLELVSRRLRVGLDFLLVEVRGHRAHRRRVDVHQGRGAGRFVRHDLGGLRGRGLCGAEVSWVITVLGGGVSKLEEMEKDEVLLMRWLKGGDRLGREELD